MSRFTHGESRPGKQSKEYRSWVAMKKRCTYEKHPKFQTYSKLGISSVWMNSFSEFLNCVGRAPSETHTLDRIDTTRGYFPGNVRWATPKEQGRNRVDSVSFSIDGVNYTVSEAAEKFGLKYSTIRERLKRGYRGHDVVAPVGKFSRWKPAT